MITQRTKILIEQYQVEPHRILVITFTKAAATEMKARFQALMEGRFTPVQFGTFHAIFFSILKHAYHYNANNIIQDSQKKQFLQEIMQQFDLEIEDENEFIADVEKEISFVKGEQIPLEDYASNTCEGEIFRKVYQQYEYRLHRHKLLDFDDMLVYCYELLKARNDILQMWQRQFSYILIDEFQDINRLQYEIIKMLAKPKDNLFVVGDDDQSIYGFRGAKPEMMLQFREVYPQAKRVVLNRNYRSTASIVQTAARVIQNNKKRFWKDIRAENEAGKEVVIREFETVSLENEQVIADIQRHREAGGNLSEIAVLFRTNTQPRAFIAKLLEYNIPFRMKERVPNIYEHWIAKDIMTYIKIALGQRERDLFLQIMNRPKRYLGREVFDSPTVDLERVRMYYEEKEWMVERIDRLEYDLKALACMAPYAAIHYIRKGMDYDTYITEYAAYRHIKAEDLFALLDELQEEAKPFHHFEDWFAYIANYALELEEQMQKKEKQEIDCVNLVTMHGAKGLEFDVVFIIEANEGIMPHKRAILEEEIEEERRMFYVAMTRAKKELFIYYVQERFNKELNMSRFVAEILEKELGKEAFS